MRWSLHIARIAGIDVKIHVTFFLLLLFYGFFFYGQGGAPAAVSAVVFILLVFLCVLLHEFGHAIAAKKFGIHTPDITLLPIGGVARLERMPEKPYEELIVAIAGPLVNVVIAALLWPFVSFPISPAVLEKFSAGLVAQIFLANLMLVFFNLIPAFPMDGGRILRALLAMRLDYARATGIAASIGQALAFTGGLIGLLIGKPLLVLVAIFVFFGAQNEAAHAEMRAISNGLRVCDAMVTRFEALPRQATLNAAIEAILHTSQRDFPVVNENGDVVGIITIDSLKPAIERTGADTPLVEVMRTDVPAVDEAMFFDRAFQIMQQANTPMLPVLDRQRRLIGLFTPENVGEFMMIQSALSSAPRRRAAVPPPLPRSTQA
jgi:stage IV sporulation protein FB